MKLYEHQQKIVDINPQRSLLCWDTGTGKSLASIELAIKNGGATLIICPKALKEKWWRDIDSHKRTKGIEWMVMTKEEFRKKHKDIRKYANIIVDESHYFAGPKSQMSKSLYNYIKTHDPRVWLLTATPFMSSPWNIYTLARHLGHEWNYMSFKEKFFELSWIGVKGARRAIPVTKEGIEDEIARLVGNIGDIVRLDECVDVPDQVFKREDFKLSPAQKTKIEAQTEINPIVRFTKNHEIENGFLISDGYDENEFFDNEKNPRILEYVKQYKKVAIICRYNLQIEGLRKYLASSKKPIYVINGAAKNRDEIVQEIEKDNECIVLINASCSEGYELPSVGIIIFASLSFSYVHYKQVCGRFLRINKLKKNVYIHMILSEGVDEAVYDSIMRKQSFSIEIYAQANIPGH